MKMSKVYDLPTRLFHWMFAVSFVSAFIIAKVVDDESSVYVYHMLLGFILTFLVLFRLIWGVIGSPYAKFSSFQLAPRKLVGYFKQMVSGKTERTAGHNPASSWAALIMMGLTLGLAITGVMMVLKINKEFVEDIHELFANLFLLVSIGHVLGIFFHTIRHKDKIGLSMIHGMKQDLQVDGIKKNHTLVALILVICTGIFGYQLINGFDANSGKLEIFGSSLQLGEQEGDD